MENLNERLNDMLESYPGLMDDNIMNLDLEEIIKDDLWVDKFVDDDTSIKQRYSINEITHHHPEQLKNQLMLVNKD